MNNNFNLELLLAGTLLIKRMEGVRIVYEEADRRIEEFKKKSSIECPAGCGICCEGFLPDVLACEADYIALYLLDKGLSFPLPRHRKDLTKICSFYKKERDLHCGIYTVRPLICRLFGFASVKDRYGTGQYRYCREMKKGDSQDRQDLKPPVMAEYGLRLECLDQGDKNQRVSLNLATLKALEKLQLLYFMASQGVDPDSSGRIIFRS